MTTTPSTSSSPDHHEPGREPQPAQGRIAGAVLRAARLSAGLSPRQLATALGLADTLILFWENGAEPLACVPVPRIDRLKTALRTAGAEAPLIADLDAAWCDLVGQALIVREDASCLLADPLAQQPAFAELLLWLVGGKIPSRYSRFVSDPAPPGLTPPSPPSSPTPATEHEQDTSPLTKERCYLPEQGWGRLDFADASPAAGKAYTDDGQIHENRGLKGRHKGRPNTNSRGRRPTRHVPIPPCRAPS